MSQIDLDQIKYLREKTGAGVVEVKKALDEAGGDEVKAIDLLKMRGAAKAVKKAEREAKEGLVVSYIHTNGKIGVLLTLLCETDFVARNPEFHSLGRDIAMHIAAMNPQVLRPEDVPLDIVAHERALWEDQMKEEKKPAEVVAKILVGKEKKFREEQALLTQSYVKNPTLTVGDLITENIHRIGENIQVGSFVRYEI